MDKRPRRERKRERERERETSRRVNIARGFISPPLLVLNVLFLLLLHLLLLSPHLLPSRFSSSLDPWSVCGSPQIIRINIITSLGAASLFLSPRSTHHDATHDRFRAPVKPSPFSSFPVSSYLAARSNTTAAAELLDTLYTIHFVSFDDSARYAAAHSPDVPSIMRNKP